MGALHYGKCPVWCIILLLLLLLLSGCSSFQAGLASSTRHGCHSPFSSMGWSRGRTGWGVGPAASGLGSTSSQQGTAAGAGAGTESPIENIPTHVAYIIDGNGRWAERRGLRRPEGHNAGANTTVDIVKATFDAGVQYVTLYVFSTENWARPTPEVGNIMDLLNAYLKDVSPYLVRHKIHLKVIGEKHRLSALTQQLLDAAGYKGGSRDPAVPESAGVERVGGVPNPEVERVLCLAISYGGRQDVVQSAQKLAERVRRAELRVEDIDEATFAQGTYLGMLGIPDPDLILRTSGEFRLSNFLLWQSAYAELATVECLWPDFTPEMAREALRDFGTRSRRFGR
ncbi:Decaprenyl diphosphate synthase-like protein [Ochromonadaceae sp. CCMP2298]|nr:Decaprenyl diphosphate synthase-like protein [Ochromonadaceae sp. CCMP2298]|mmetsp:Transcript_22546/g.50965  ORF Transcript_22546/g.50965 Transcript_22546/m.50965 type:complete len:341 (+) Transcript_22546:106-1128(+)